MCVSFFCDKTEDELSDQKDQQQEKVDLTLDQSNMAGECYYDYNLFHVQYIRCE